MKIAPYLTIAGKPIKLGAKFFAVNALPPFDISECIAERQNNIHGYCYFLEYDEAVKYSESARLNHTTSKYLKRIENQCLGK